MNRLIALLVIFCLSLTGCASMMSYEDRVAVAPYQETFALHSNGKYSVSTVKNVPIYIYKFRTFDRELREWVDNDKVVGVCYPVGFITLSKKWWNSHHDPLEREQLIFHELGHCLLHKGHTKPSLNTGIGGQFEKLLFSLNLREEVPDLSDKCPASYMNPILFDTIYKDYVSFEEINCLEKHYKYYVEELFNRITREEYENNGHQIPN